MSWGEALTPVVPAVTNDPLTPRLLGICVSSSGTKTVIRGRHARQARRGASHIDLHDLGSEEKDTI
ncbi:hypothetical protein E2C01_019431 [Portunus trituberculatus]|uniref:Uncharacterized protein n=1 Tax=Portunus trituberculatus TaxID=210409 RepID=A0A5B7DY90_PORTR|nr:hypothetical protein [Portunus trituberculatus]